ncbi:hypothetical protein TNIN_106601 [Trichonephila inaurata madagascariensis]|uniref:Uncharacterized protein n=1 Tax=Trichonephila inaurata madagascariensis TaxID=2747483 RepID=A0A8X6XAP0_9ARAC|nr:hypothetical protein TNIN_106601 [Trichonephila inaurata madagascariensis]
MENNSKMAHVPKCVSGDDGAKCLDPPPPKEDQTAADNQFDSVEKCRKFILENFPDFKTMYEQGEQELGFLFTQVWALRQNCPSAPGKIQQALEERRKFESLYKDSEEKRKNLEKEMMKTKYNAEQKLADMKRVLERVQRERDFYREYCERLL